MTNHYDLIVIGAGPGGYVAADRAAAAGKRVLLVEKAQLGGVCLNAGCIPSKTLLSSAKQYTQIAQAAKYGIQVDGVRLDFAAVHGRVNRVVRTLRDGVAYQMDRRSITVMQGEAAFIDRTQIRIGDDVYSASNIIIATGASPVIADLPGIDLPHVLTTTQMFARDHLPERLIILGAGPIALGVATIYGLLGVHVSVIGADAQLLPEFDAEQVNLLAQELPTQNIRLHLNTQVRAITTDGVEITSDGDTRHLPADVVLICGARQPNVTGFGLDHLDLDVDEQGIRVDAQMRTNLPGIYAIGDVTGLSMWAHSASRMAEVAVNTMLGRPDRFQPEAVPLPVYTQPEMASVGLTEAQAKARGISVKTARLPMNANGRFIAEYEGKRGLCKVVVDAQTRVLLGVQMIGAGCIEQSFGAAAMIGDEFRVDDVKQMTFPHPTVSELIKDTLYELRL